MNVIAIAFAFLNAISLLFLPRRWASLPILVGACYMPIEQSIEIGPLHFSVIRLLIGIGFIRLMVRGERLTGSLNSIDWLMVAWAAWALCSSMFHKDIGGTLINHLGIVYNACGVYFFLRIVCQSIDDVVQLCRLTALLLIPLSIEMLCEKFTGRNIFSVLGGVPEMSAVRDGKIRASGPFAHSILGGTAGAVNLPLMVVLWQQNRKTAIAGIVACFLMVFASTSSGPIMSTFFGIGALLMWYCRQYVHLLRWLAVMGYIGLDLVMKVPAYWIISRIDLTGSSTSWHRAALIEAAVKHFNEWWLAGTDYTRHWMEYGVGWSPNHIDVTNHYLRMGIDGGLLLMILFIFILVGAFSSVGHMLQQADKLPSATSPFVIWALGASLFSHAASFFSVSYFDQSFVFLYLTIAVISLTSTSIQDNISPVNIGNRVIPSPTKPRRSVDELSPKHESNKSLALKSTPQSRYKHKA